MDPKPTASTISGRRFSASGEASRREELERLKRATPVQRMAIALALGRRRKQLLDEYRLTRELNAVLRLERGEE